MKCPVCQAKLLPVDGEMFCLQCGQTLHARAAASDRDDLKLEETSDPMLQRAIRDAGNYETQFIAPPEKEIVKEAPAAVKPAAEPAPKVQRRSFVSLHAVVMAPRGLTPAGMLLTGSADPAAETGAGTNRERREFVRVRAGRPQGSLRRWWAGAAVVAAFAGLNLGISNYYSDRVYPGVKVGSVSVGGWTFAELSARLPALLKEPSITASVQGRTYPLDLSRAATVSQETVERSVKEMGRQSPLPVAGALQAWSAAPVKAQYSLTDEALDQAVTQLAAKVDRSPADAAITTVGSSVIILADKPGAQLDRPAAAAAIRAAYGAASTVSLSLVKVPPKVSAAAYENDKAAAEAVIGQNVQIVLLNVKYAPTAAQLAGWITFRGPGQGVAIDASGPAAFVAAIPGSFDRAAAAASLTSAVAAHQTASLTASTKRITAGPPVAAALNASPAVSYKYCVQSSLSDSSSLKTAAAAALGTGGGWTLGGRIKYEEVRSGCNMELQITDGAALTRLDPACTNQSTCRIHNDLAINSVNWSTPPSWWKGDLTAYRQELINHLMGQWLGFDHAGCQGGTPQTPLTQATITVPGCSPSWHPVPPDLQDTKVLAGF